VAKMGAGQVTGLLAIVLLALLPTVSAEAAEKCNSYNYADRKGYILNFAPGLQITEFDFCNRNSGNEYSPGEFMEILSWKNVGNVPVVSFELRTIQFDPFNRQLVGSRTIIPGTDSARWKYLTPGQVSTDGMISHSVEHVYTAIGTVWTVDHSQVVASVKSVVATFEDKDEASKGQTAANSPPAK
jgi:hypothetical protein